MYRVVAIPLHRESARCTWYTLPENLEGFNAKPAIIHNDGCVELAVGLLGFGDGDLLQGIRLRFDEVKRCGLNVEVEGLGMPLEGLEFVLVLANKVKGCSHLRRTFWCKGEFGWLYFTDILFNQH